jgi:hypothetical protein
MTDIRKGPTTGNEDIEAATAKSRVSGIVLGNNDSKDVQEALAVAPTVQQKNDPCIFFMSFFYILLVVALFVWPRVNAGRSDADGFSELAAGIAIVLGIGGLALITATVSLLITVSRWPRLTTVAKVLGVFPVMCSIAIIVTIVVLVRIRASENHPPCPMNATSFNSTYPCQSPKNNVTTIVFGSYED